MKAFLVVPLLVIIEFIAWKLAGLYISWYIGTAKAHGANMIRPKDVMGPYFTALAIGFALWMFYVMWLITDSEKKEK